MNKCDHEFFIIESERSIYRGCRSYSSYPIFYEILECRKCKQKKKREALYDNVGIGLRKELVEVQSEVLI